MDELEKQKNNLKAVLEVGLTVQTISVIVTYCLRREKREFLDRLNQLIAELQESLSSDEKEELRKDVEAMVQQRMEQILTELSLELPEEEVEKVVEEIKKFSLTMNN